MLIQKKKRKRKWDKQTHSSGVHSFIHTTFKWVKLSCVWVCVCQTVTWHTPEPVSERVLIMTSEQRLKDKTPTRGKYSVFSLQSKELQTSSAEDLLFFFVIQESKLIIFVFLDCWSVWKGLVRPWRIFTGTFQYFLTIFLTHCLDICLFLVRYFTFKQILKWGEISFWVELLTTQTSEKRRGLETRKD